LKADIPGLTADDVSIKVQDNKLEISANRKEDLEVSEDSEKIKSERKFGKIFRSLRLAKDVDVKNIRASAANGVLTVIAPRIPDENVVNIPVE